MANKESHSRPAIFDELFESQKARNELMKWKLIIVSIAGSFSLGFLKTDTTTNLFMVILVIPFSCVYVDLLCRNLSIRTKKISKFISNLPDEDNSNIDIQYHKHYHNLKKQSGSSFETFALIFSTILITVCVVILGLLISKSWEIKYLFVGLGILNIVCSVLVEIKYRKEKKIVFRN